MNKGDCGGCINYRLEYLAINKLTAKVTKKHMTIPNESTIKFGLFDSKGNEAFIFSPENTKVAYVSIEIKDNAKQDVYVFDFVTQKLNYVTTLSAEEGVAEWKLGLSIKDDATFYWEDDNKLVINDKHFTNL